MSKWKDNKRIKKIGMKIVVVTLCTMVIYILSLYVLSQYKTEDDPRSFESMINNPGIYEVENRIGNIILSKTIIETGENNEFDVTSKNYPMMFWLPVITTTFIVIILFGLGSLVKKKTKKMEI